MLDINMQYKASNNDLLGVVASVPNYARAQVYDMTFPTLGKGYLMALIDPTNHYRPHFNADEYGSSIKSFADFAIACSGDIPAFICYAGDDNFVDDVCTAYSANSGCNGEPLPNSERVYVIDDNGVYKDMTPIEPGEIDDRDSDLHPMMVVCSGAGSIYIYEYGLVVVVPAGDKVCEHKMRRFD